mmetsp:Transcript_35182/g.112543  ORF Transcript_35182/g.112543 Transcript_35182/m.112543 type:complete len:310 (-) Transcript_35182:152-1081(-)
MLPSLLKISCVVVVAVGYAPAPLESAVKSARVKLAELSLEDVRWRRQAVRATRKVRPLGDSEAVATVEQFQRVVSAILDEEASRAEQIVLQKGEFVRPMSLEMRGPLGELEEKLVGGVPVVEFFRNVRNEVRLIVESEKVRATRVKNLGRTRGRPKDAPPSALGRLEKFFDALFREERNRDITQRPIDNPAQGPLAKAEKRAVNLLDTVNSYERRRLDVLLRAGVLRRPMEQPRRSPLGILESLVTGVVRAPLLVAALVDSVKDELESARIIVSQRKGDDNEDNDHDLSQVWWDDIYDEDDERHNAPRR